MSKQSWLSLFVAILPTPIGYLINQLPGIPDFPYKERVIWAGVLMLTAIGAYWVWQQGRSTEVPIASLESGRRMRLIQSHVEVVKKRLEDALARSAMIPLDLKDASSEVGQSPLKDLQVAPIVAPRGIFDRAKKFLSFGRGVEIALPTQTKMIEVLRRDDVSGRLLILGHPGAGKTTTLLELARDLLVEAQETGAKRIPHVFEMSRWVEGLDLVEYLALELKREHTLDLAIGRGMAMSGELLPLLDGLDELRDPRVISAAMGAINRYLAGGSDRDAVVCCRVLDYGLASEQLRELNGAIELQPLSESAIQRYLNAVGKGELWDLVEQNPGLVRSDDSEMLPLLKTPLFLSVFAAVSPTIAVKSEADLWDAYIVKQLGIPAEKLSGKGYKRYEGTKEPTQKQTKNYLIFLAKQLQRTTEVMLIEEMQPTWLRSEPKVLGRSVQQWQYSLIGGLIGGLIFNLIFGLNSIVLVEEISILISDEAQLKIIRNLKEDFISVPFVGLLGNVGRFFDLMERYVTDLKVRSEPNQGIKASVESMLVAMLSLLMIGGIIQIELMPYLQRWMTPELFQLFPSLVAPAITFTIVFLIGGALIQHVSLRITLYLSRQKPNDNQTRCIPWNYARFLSYAADRKLLQQTGGAYRFIHRSLLEHFAKMGET